MLKNNADILKTKNNFFHVVWSPGVIGCSDGISYMAPKEDEIACVNRKRFHFINF